MPFFLTILATDRYFQSLLEEQLSDDREWLFDTETPSLADVSVYFIYNWIRWNKELFDVKKFPKSLKVSIDV